MDARQKEQRAIWVGIIFTLLSAILWGSTYTAIQIALRYYDPYEISFFRAVFGTLTLLFYYLLKRRKAHEELIHLPQGVRTWFLLILTSVFGAAGFWTLLNLSVLYLQADTASFLAALYPLIVLPFASIFLKENMTATKGIGVVLGIIGAFVIVAFNGNARISGAEPLIGILSALGTSFFFAAYIITSRILIGRKYSVFSNISISPEFVTLMTFLISILPTFVIFGLTSPLQGLFHPSIEGILLVLYLGVVTSGIAFLFFNTGLKIIGASRAAINQLLFPAVAVILSYIFLGESINLASALGIILILGGIIVAQRITQLIRKA